MKDSKGHGSEAGHGHGFVTRSGKGIMPRRPFRQGTSNEQAAQALMSGLKSTQAHIHDAFVNAAARGPEHASVGASLRAAAANERDNAVVQRDRFSARVERDAASRARDKSGARASAAMRAYKTGTWKP